MRVGRLRICRLLMWVVLFAILFIAVIGVEQLVGPAVRRSKLEQLEKGMTKNQVLEVLGRPRKIESERQWIYSRSGNYGWVEVFFDDCDRLTGVNDESAFPTLYDSWNLKQLQSRN